MSDAGTLVQPPPTNPSSVSNSQPPQGFQTQYAHMQQQHQQQQQLSHIVYQQSPQQQHVKQEVKQEGDTVSSNNYESQNQAPQNAFQNGSRSYEAKNGNGHDGNGNTDNGNVTFTTLTTFRTSNGASENGAPNDEYVPNGGNILFGLPPGLLMPTNSEENGSNGGHAQPLPQPPTAPHGLVPGTNGLMLAPPPHLAQQHHGLYPPQGLHQPPPHFQIPSHFMANAHPPLPHHQPAPHVMHELGGPGLMESKIRDGHMIGPGGMLTAPSSSSDVSPMNHAIGGGQYGHFIGDNGASTASSGGGHSTPSSSAEDATDPYLCVWCSFKTIYKGNMKRHLISCHGGITDELLRKLSFDVDRLRKLCPNRPHVNELPIMPKAPRQPTGQGGEPADGVDNIAPKTPKVTKLNSGSSGSGRKRSTNGGNGSTGADNGNRGRPRKSAKGDKTLKEDKTSPLPDEVFKKDAHDEVLRQNGAASSSPSTASIPARLNSKTSASSAAASPSLMALSSGVAATSLMSPPLNSMASTAVFAGGHSLLQTAPPPPQSISQLQHAFSDPNHPSHTQFGGPFSAPPHPSLFMVVNPANGASQSLQGGPQAFNPAGMPHPLMVSVPPHSQAPNHPNLQHVAPPASHFQQLDAMAAAGFPQPIYISSGAYPLQLPPQQPIFVQQPTFQPRLQQLGGGFGQPPDQSPNFATLSTIKAPIKECGQDSRISLHSYNTGLDL